MKHVAYADREHDVNTAIYSLLSSGEKFICYRSEPRFGITAFFHRLCFLLRSTKSVVCLYAELSDNSRSPLHEALKKIVIKNGTLYQTLQMYADEYYGEKTQPLLDSLLKDFSYMGETLSQILEQPKSAPIYTGFYPDAIKDLFFHLIKNELSDKTVVLFIDNIQFIDNSSIYDVLALMDFPNVKVVMSQTGHSDLSEKLFLEIEIANELHFLDFNEPPVECVQKLWDAQTRSISKDFAQVLIRQANGDIRKLVYSAQHGALPNDRTRSLLANEILILIHTLEGTVTIRELFDMIAESPTCNLSEISDVIETTHRLVQWGLLSSVMQMNGEELFYARIRDDNQQTWDSLIPNPADALIYQDIVFRHLSKKDEHGFEELIRLFNLSKLVFPQHMAYWGRELLMESLRRGSSISSDWIDAVRKLPETKDKFLRAICLFRTWKYSDALEEIMPVWKQFPNNRDVKILYTLTLNRCRKHGEANTLLWDLINSSKNVDEKAVLLSITISNCIHSGQEATAKKIAKKYRSDIRDSKKYGYFLRNAATLFQGEDAESLWNDALHEFQSVNDEYGEFTTISNMARIYIHQNNARRAKETLERAYNGLMPYGMEQLHIVANNLGATYLCCGDVINAKRHLRIARLIAKSIMPRTYITINDCCVLLYEQKEEHALTLLEKLGPEIEVSSLPRLKRRYYLALSGIFCLCEDYTSALSALKKAESSHRPSSSRIRQQIMKNCMKQIKPDITQWRSYVAPAFLEYWISNPLAIMSKDALSDEAFI